PESRSQSRGSVPSSAAGSEQRLLMYLRVGLLDFITHRITASLSVFKMTHSASREFAPVCGRVPGKKAIPPWPLESSDRDWWRDLFAPEPPTAYWGFL